MRRAAAGSIVVHGALVLVLVLIGRRDDDAPAPDSDRVDLIDVAFAPTPPPPPTPAATPPTSSPGPSGGRAAGAARASAHRVAAPVRSGARTDTIGELLGGATIDRGGGGGEGGQGGAGGGRGTGIGLGDGGSIPSTTALAPPPPPKPSKARPARLIFPSRQEPVETYSRLFVMSVVVDEDGYVAGARLVHGWGTTYDRKAEQEIWRFRYEPALDDDGRAIRAQLDQSFLIE